jgi:hypothetical protein
MRFPPRRRKGSRTIPPRWQIMAALIMPVGKFLNLFFGSRGSPKNEDGVSSQRGGEEVWLSERGHLLFQGSFQYATSAVSQCLSWPTTTAALGIALPFPGVSVHRASCGFGRSADWHSPRSSIWAGWIAIAPDRTSQLPLRARVPRQPHLGFPTAAWCSSTRQVRHAPAGSLPRAWHRSPRPQGSRES